MKAFWTLHFWKEKLLLDLNNNILDVSDWEKFIAEAEKRGCFEMALDMRERLDYYRVNNANRSIKSEN
jgi:hypothetical protein